jgi:uncharacterized protein DUF3147
MGYLAEIIVMRITLDLSAARKTKWYEYAIRFVFGGTVTAVAGLIAKEFGPSIGGLFLAFPAIFPASATLIEKHEKEKKEERGLSGIERGTAAAGVDAAGASIGTIGLISFALTLWFLISTSPPELVLAAATVAWFTVSVVGWYIRDTFM